MSTASYEEALERLAADDPRIAVLTAENRASIRGLSTRLGGRFVDVGIAEQTLVGLAAGLAARGRVPVVHALAAFLTMRAFEFIRTDVAIAHLPVKLVGAVPGILSEANGPTHQALEDVALMRGIPGMGVFCPADLDDMLLGLPAVVADPSPFYVRFNARPAAWSHAPFVLGRLETVLGTLEGEDVHIFVAGGLATETFEAAEILIRRGLTVGLSNVRTLEPFDSEAALSALENAAIAVTVEDHFLRGGLHTAIAELLVESGLSRPLLPIGFRGRWFKPGLLADVLRTEDLTSDAIAERVRDFHSACVTERAS
jgi:transketolase